MPKAKPYFSIVIPAHNEGKYLPRLLKSLALQDYTEPFEIIVIDNASSDNTSAVAKKAGATVLSEKRIGLPQARETGRRASKGEVLVFLDADMLLPPHYLTSLYALFSNQPEVIAATNPFTFYDGTLAQDITIHGYTKIIYRGQNALLRLRGLPSQLLGGNFAIRADVLKQVGGFDLDTTFEGDDLGITKKLAHKGRIVVLPELYTKTSARRFNEHGTLKTSLFYLKEFFDHLD